MQKKSEVLDLAEIHRLLHESEKNKQEILSRINALKESCLNREITHMEYLEQMKSDLNGLSLPEWVAYYENYQDICAKQLENRR